MALPQVLNEMFCLLSPFFSKYVVSVIRIIEIHSRCDEWGAEGDSHGQSATNSVASGPAETRAESIISGGASDQRTISDQDVLTSKAGHDAAIHAEIYLVRSRPASPCGFFR